MIKVSTINELKAAALTLTPSLKVRRSKISFSLTGSNEKHKPGIEWYELWQNADMIESGDVPFSTQEGNPGLIPIQAGKLSVNFCVIVGIEKSGDKVLVICDTFD